MNEYLDKPLVATAETVGLAPSWSEWIDADDVARLTSQCFLRACCTGEASLPALRTFLVQHHHYSRYFTRFLCALISNLPEPGDVKHIAQNLIEEMGADEREGITHAELYQSAMRAAGTEPSDMPAFQATRGLVDAMFDHCRRPDALEGLAALCLGAEAIVPIIYKPVINGLRALGLSEDTTRFFTLHVEDDEDHAMAMLDIMERLTDGQPVRRKRAVAIGRHLIDLRITMLDAVAENGRFIDHICQ